MSTKMKRFLGFLTAGRVAVALAVASCATPGSNAQAQPLRGAVGPYEVEVLANGVPAPTFMHGGETYVLGQMGERYTLRVWNRSGRRIEAVVSVDGRDVVDGKQGDFRGKRGYLVPAWGSVDIDGWRLSSHQAAAFRFTSVPDSYSARMGTPRNVGVIGVAVFPERAYAPPPRPIYPEPYSYRRSPPADYGRDADSYEEREGARGDDARSAAGPAPSATAPPPASPAPSAESSGAGSSAPRGALADKSAAKSARRPGLGTEFGESVSSHVREVNFVRANASSPAVIMGVRYNDRNGLVALGIDVDQLYGVYDDADVRRTADPFPVSHRPYAAPPPGWRR